MKKLTRYIFSRFGGGIVTRSEVEETCERFGADASNTINFMISYGYFVRILRGLYYVKTLEEFKLKRAVDAHRIISLGLERLGINWYFGLYTALRLNGLTHEFFETIFVLNDRIFRPKEIGIAGRKVKFIKLKSGLFGFGVIRRDGDKFSDPEKTILDFIYVLRYRGVPERRIISIIEDYGKNLDRRRLGAYLRFYPKSVGKTVKDAGLI
ncbi:MAG: type IV toxin-antitoxin system AbiEi family antitoxin domain-containing protein [Candidatus Asgardarchaeia archaeon]